jgi:hypothetical protein
MCANSQADAVAQQIPEDGADAAQFIEQIRVTTVRACSSGSSANPPAGVFT